MKKKEENTHLPISLVFFQNSGEMDIYRYFLGSMTCMTSVECFYSNGTEWPPYKLRAGTQGSNLEEGLEAEARKEHYLLAYCSQPPYTTFLYKPRTTCPGVALFNNGLGPHLLKYFP